MLPAAHHADRRRALRARVDGPILLLGNTELPRTLPMSPHPFRQDSSFLYLTGCTEPGAALLMDDDGDTLFLPDYPAEDALWHGPRPDLSARAAALGFDRARPTDQLAAALGDRVPRTLAVADPTRNHQLEQLTGRPHRFGQAHGDTDLVEALIVLRRTKTTAELDALRQAAAVTGRAHQAVMRAARPGASERALCALFEGVLAAGGATPGYGTILTVRGEVLHNHAHDQVLQAGQLLLLDGGGEVDSGYTVDITRTTPVSGRFSPRQRAAYDAVLAAQHASIAACQPGTRFREVHDASSAVIAQFLADEGLLRCSPDAAVEAHAHALFFPHGVGHLLGLDVHDLENFGDLPAYPAGASRPDAFGTRNLRLDLPLEPDWVVTIEPGFYVVPAILADPVLRERFDRVVDFARAEAWLGFGGIRIEDDIHVTADGPDNLTATTPSDPDQVEALAGSGPSAESVLCCC